ncbi:hypothetical protein TNCV_4075751 [Trichonephila clavipes]|nr:hypothetical protein TNCV_4075751 [Trichonephila clavipes]
MPYRCTPRACYVTAAGSLKMTEPLALKTAQRIRNAQEKLHPGVPPRTTASIKGGSVPVICSVSSGTPKRGTTSRLTGAGSLLPPVYSEAWAKVKGDRYRAMITNFFIPELNNHDVQELWFQQDGATCHTARATIDLLKDTFGDRLISRFGPVN